MHAVTKAAVEERTAALELAASKASAERLCADSQVAVCQDLSSRLNNISAALDIERATRAAGEAVAVAAATRVALQEAELVSMRGDVQRLGDEAAALKTQMEQQATAAGAESETLSTQLSARNALAASR